MDPQAKTTEILNTLERRSTLIPRKRPVDSKISSIDQVPWKATFSIFNPRHLRSASQLLSLLLEGRLNEDFLVSIFIRISDPSSYLTSYWLIMDQKIDPYFKTTQNFEEYLDILEEVREFENDGLFLYTLYSSVRHRDDTRGVVLPPIEERIPHWFFAAETIHDAIQMTVHRPNADHLVENQSTAEDTDPESRLAYFREDIGLNRHHWSWHVVYPSDWDEAATGKIRDRKGEIFYYMHQQMLARYDCERLCNELDRVKPLHNFLEEMEPYFPHLTSQNTGVHFSARPPGLQMVDVPDISVYELEMWRLRILDSIDQGYVRDVSGNKITLGNEKGIDILSAIVEASSDSINPGYYGSLHIMGHLLISSVHDPNGRFRGLPGVMGFSESAPRDPIFFRWHKYIDDIFNRHKVTLSPYTRDELSLNGIKIVSAEVKGTRTNVMETFMREGRSDLSHAPFLRTNGKILVKYEHLDHEPLTFTFKIENNTKKDKEVTVRVFLGPKYDKDGNPFDLNEQRRLMIELDKSKHRLVPGMNTVTRSDDQSSVTLSRNIRSYRSLKAGNVSPEMGYCSCGWPDHLLIPKGTPAGMDFVLFVMCTDYNEDKPDGSTTEGGCNGAVSYCGSRDEKYPDKKPMGFPFDRRIAERSFDQFVTDNMRTTDVKIIYSNEVRPVTEWVTQMYINN